MATTTNYSWSTPDDTALVKDGAAAIRSLGTAIDTTVFTNAGAAVTKATVDAKGDLIAGTADNTVARLAVGANDTILTADSSTATGLKWAAPAAAGGMTLISETVASANTGIDFTSISGTYKQLLLTWSGLYHSAAGSAFALRFNADSGNNYISNTIRINNGGTATVDISAGARASGASMFGSDSSSTTAQETIMGYFVLDNYASSTKLKSYFGSFGYRTATNNEHWVTNGHYASATAVTQLNITRIAGTDTINNITNTTIRLYGVS